MSRFTRARKSLCFARMKMRPGFTGVTGWAITTILRHADLPRRLHAVDAIIETIEANPGLVLVTFGPLTNLRWRSRKA